MPRKKVNVQMMSYVISVSLGTGCYRHLRVSAETTFYGLSWCTITTITMWNRGRSCAYMPLLSLADCYTYMPLFTTL